MQKTKGVGMPPVIQEVLLMSLGPCLLREVNLPHHLVNPFHQVVEGTMVAVEDLEIGD